MKRAKPHFFKCLALLLLFFSFAPLNAQAKNVYPLDPVYHRPEDITRSLWSRVDTNQELCQWEIIGVSNNAKLPIYALSISNPKTGSKYSKPSVLFHGQHHGEEPIGVEIVFALSEYLLNNYGKDRQVTYFVDNYNLWFIPTMNPEGFAITNNGKYRLKRKNNTDTNLNGLLEIDKDGVDLNRNYPFNWDKDFNDNPDSPYYKGFEPASESENRAMINFYAREQFQLALFYHTSATGNYSEKIYFPWKWDNITSPDYQEMLFLAKHLAKNLPNAYKKGHYSVQTLNTSQQGFARDYIYSQHNTLAFLLEVAG
ncbi:MAG: M14 family zinc carboxypeptidase, partial [Candidatus Cloacimonas sp.]|nr:hypothetical protein [Candidatus Cloacimonadota bacterium]